MKEITKMLLLIMCFCCIGFLGGKRPAKAWKSTYKPIRGVRMRVKNKDAKVKWNKMQTKVKEQKTENYKTEEALEEVKEHLQIYKTTEKKLGNQVVFIDNHMGNTLLDECAFDEYLNGIRQYGTADRNDVDSYIIDINPYLSYQIFRLEEQAAVLQKSLENGKKRLEKLRKNRNRINTKDIVFVSKDVTVASNISVKEMKDILCGTALKKYASTYVKIEQKYGINAVAFCSLSALESGWGRSRRALRDHNYTGFGVYTDSSVGINASSGEANLMMTAKHIAKHYLHKGDMYYHGKGLDGLNRCYAASRTWAYAIENIGIRLMHKVQKKSK